LIGFGVLGFKITDQPVIAGEGPMTQHEDDWMGWVPFSYRPAANSPEVVTFDIKSQRRMDELGMTLTGVFDVGALASTTGISVVCSVLITLP
jgi:hypothetical protein